jgi:DNA modification methylase
LIPELKVKPIHPFPARMAPEVALRHLKSRRSYRVLDPMVGSGTVAKIAHSLGHRAIGCDTDPLALLIAETWCVPVSATRLRNAAQKVLRGTSNWKSIPAQLAYPPNADDETKRFIRYWFDLSARRQITSILRGVSQIKSRSVRLYLFTAMSRTIIVKDKGVSLAKDVAHSRPHRSYKKSPVEPLLAFRGSVKKMASYLESQPISDKPAPEIFKGDARHLPVKSRSIDVVMTSPPYLNAIDYLRGHKLALVWFGHQIEQLRKLRSTNIGTESGLPSTDEHRVILKAICSRQKLGTRQEAMLIRYIRDVQQFISEISRVLKPKGRCILVVGDCNLRGTYIRNSRAMLIIAKSNGLRLQRDYRRRIPSTRRYLPPPGARDAGSQMGRRMRSEIVLVFSKQGA